MKLSPFFSDGMVLQRDAENLIKGTAKPESRIIVTVKDLQGKNARIEGQADGAGAFILTLPPFPAADGVTLLFEEYPAGENNGNSNGNGNRSDSPADRMEIKDAAFGDVFLLSGQSNMELPVMRTLDVTEKVVAASDYPLIREFAVPMVYDFTGPIKELTGGEWKQASGQPLLSFGAAGFFMARALYEKYRVPIGLVRAAIGGTPIQAWCSEETIRELSEFAGEIELCRKAGYIEGIQKQEEKEQKEWYEQAGQFAEVPLGASGEITVPGLWEGTALSEFHGSLILEKEFYLDEVSEDSARVYLGAIVDADKVYINGHPVGETGYRYPPRKYDFPAAYLKKGSNHIKIEMFVFRETGGFIPGKPYYVRCGGETVSLSGVWDYRIVRTMPVLPDLTFFQYKASGLYNGMLSPLAGHTFKGMAFYQGESNTHKPEGYSNYFDRAVFDWRQLFKNPSLPIVYVQLAGFSDSRVPGTGTAWAVLRNEQRRSLTIPGTAMVSAADIGEYNDLHPQNKLVLGERLALAMEKLAYGEDVVCSGPLYDGIQTEENKVRITFTNTGSGLAAKGTKGEVYGVELAGADGVFYKAKAFTEGDTVSAWCGEVESPKKCRYAWNDDPTEANLYNAEGLPASCFLSE